MRQLTMAMRCRASLLRSFFRYKWLFFRHAFGGFRVKGGLYLYGSQLRERPPPN
jgi:hypothetical protein